MEHPQVANMMRYGHKSFKDLLQEAIEENMYIEDVYGKEIAIGDTYYEFDGELIHVDNLAKFAIDELDLSKRVR